MVEVGQQFEVEEVALARHYRVACGRIYFALFGGGGIFDNFKAGLVFHIGWRLGLVDEVGGPGDIDVDLIDDILLQEGGVAFDNFNHDLMFEGDDGGFYFDEKLLVFVDVGVEALGGLYFEVGIETVDWGEEV